jgi:curved DNA-binding protein CbpA
MKGVTSYQVKFACKQAMFRFHPDRVKMSDVRQQVKAEETFKFITRLKEKLVPGA